MKKKIGIPAKPALVMFRALAMAKVVRGTRLDPFGHDHVRVVERQLVEEFFDILEQITAGLTPQNHDVATKIAQLPDMVRGYDEVKLRNVEVYQQQIRTLQDEFDGRTTELKHAAVR